MPDFLCVHKNCEASYNDYTYVRVIGEGSQGGATLWKDKEDRLFCFKKSPFKENETIPEAHLLMNDIGSPFLVNIHHCFVGQGEMIRVMEYCPGGSLADLVVSKVPFSRDDIWMILTQLVHGLYKLHSKNIIHRDIKADNIVLMSRERPFRVKICDFGVSKVLNSSTVASSLVGTIYYIAPEVLGNGEYTTAVDIWSLGILLYFLIKGEYPFKTLEGIINDPMPKFDFEFGDIVSKMLVRDASQRDKAFDLVRLPNVSHIFEEHFRVLTFEEVIAMKRTLKQLSSTCSNQSLLIEKLSNSNTILSKAIQDQQSVLSSLSDQIKLRGTPQPTQPSVFNPPLFKFLQRLLKQKVLNEQLLSTVESLSIPKSLYLTSLHGISCLKKLKNLVFEYDDQFRCHFAVSDLSPLSELKTLSSLSIVVNTSSFSPLCRLVSLNSLNLVGNPDINGIQPLSCLVELTYLRLDNFSSLRSLSPLSNLFSLKSIILSNLSVLENITSLIFLQELENVGLVSCSNLKDIEALAEVSSLNNLELVNLPLLTDLSQLIHCKKLSKLSVGNCSNINCFDFLLQLDNLQSLALDNCSLTSDVSFLTRLPVLSTLNVSNCEALQQVALCTSLSLKMIELSNCSTLSLIDLSGIDSLTRVVLKNLPLDILNVSYLKKSVDFVFIECTCLKMLNYHHCTLAMDSLFTNFSCLILKNSCGFSNFDFEHFTNLTELHIDSVEANKASTLILPPNVEVFSLSSCESVNLIDFACCMKLSCINLSQVSRLQALDLSPCSNLTMMSSSQLPLLTKMTLPASLEHLERLTVQNCPCLDSNFDLASAHELTSLIVESCEQLTLSNLEYCSALITLSLCDLASTVGVLKLVWFPNICSLTINGSPYAHNLLCENSCSNLNFIELNNVAFFDATDFQCVESLILLNVHTVHGFNSTTLPKLTNLVLNNISVEELPFSNFPLLKSIKLTKVTELVLVATNNCSSLASMFLESLPDVQSISMSFNQLANFTAIDLPLLETLEFKSLLPTTVVNIEHLPLLCTLILHACPSVSKFTTSKIPNLNKVEVTQHVPYALSSIGFASQITKFALSQITPNDDLSFLLAFTNLQDLCIKDCNVGDLSFVSTFRNLRKLFVVSTSRKVLDISCLQELSQLKFLVIIGNATVVNTESLSKLNLLKYLQLNISKSVRDLSHLSGLTRLKFLEIHGSSEDNISFVSQMTLLTHFCFHSSSSITSVNPLAELTGLEHLSLSRCSDVGNLSALRGLVNLKTVLFHSFWGFAMTDQLKATMSHVSGVVINV
ncbi:hypothetical protein RCL1_008986 [Eukaryota sp. TZLM3-RCL]